MSDLSSEDRATLRDVWPMLPAQRRRLLVSDLASMSEDNIDLDFRHVFLLSLEDSDAQVRVTAIEGLYEDDSRLLLDRLVSMLRLDPDEEVREAAARALGRFTYLAQCGKLGARTEPLREALLQSARDADEQADVRRRAIEALGYFNDDGEVQTLIMGAYERGGRQAESALFAMGRSMETRWQRIELDEFESERPSMRYEAAHAAGEMVLDDVLPYQARVIGDAELEVRLSAVWALAHIGGKPAAEALVRALKSKESAMREAAQEAMEEIAFSANPLNVLR